MEPQSKIELTDEDLAIIGHVVVDPVEWVQNAMRRHGPKAVSDKIAAHRDEYFAARSSGEYKTRAEAEAEANLLLEQRLAENIAAANERFAVAVAAEVEKQLNKISAAG